MERLSIEFFNSLPDSARQDVISDLSAFSRTILRRDNGKIYSSPDSWIASSYADDHKVFGEFWYEDFKDMPEVIKGRKEYDEAIAQIPESFWD